jgi:chemotaxis protein methyltransferase CheR
MPVEKSGLSAAEYKVIQDYIYDKLGIDMDDKKKETVTTKITKLMNRRGMASPQDYIKFIVNAKNADDIQEFFNEITTNTTEFFRENEHFKFIKENIDNIINDMPRIKRNGEIRIASILPCSRRIEQLSTGAKERCTLFVHLDL